jgi:hypothetical protein
MIAEVKIGEKYARAMIKGGYTESVGGIIADDRQRGMPSRSSSPSRRVDEINSKA